MVQRVLVLFPVNTPQGGMKPQTRSVSIADLQLKIRTLVTYLE